jgi:hypothetical protein
VEALQQPSDRQTVRRFWAVASHDEYASEASDAEGSSEVFQSIPRSSVPSYDHLVTASKESRVRSFLELSQLS